MRTYEPTDSQPWHPLGEKVVKPAPAPSPKPVDPIGPSAIVTGADGRMQTTKHKA